MKDTLFSKEGDGIDYLSGQTGLIDDRTIHGILLKIISKWRAEAADKPGTETLKIKSESPLEEELQETVILSVSDLKENHKPIPAQSDTSETLIEETVIIRAGAKGKGSLSVIESKSPGIPEEESSADKIDRSTVKDKVIKKPEEEDFMAETVILKLTDKDR